MPWLKRPERRELKNRKRIKFRVRSLAKSLADVNKLPTEYECVDLTMNTEVGSHGGARRKDQQSKQGVGIRRRKGKMMRAEWMEGERREGKIKRKKSTE